MKNFMFLLLFFSFFQAQTPSEKQTKQQSQVWLAFVSSTKLNTHWDFIADVGIRWNEFFVSENVYLIRGAMNYRITPMISVAGGYAHAWSAPVKEEWDTYADENRIFEQVQFNSKLGSTGVFQRLRIEQRWQEKIVNDEVLSDIRFTNRIRYMANFNIPVFNKKNRPTLAVFDEVMFHFGQEVVYNTFDQNRFFIGIRQNLTSQLSCDFGYVNAYQQRYPGYQYEMTHLLRLFLFLNTEVKKRDD